MAWGSVLIETGVDCETGAVKIAQVTYYAEYNGKGSEFPPGMSLHDPDLRNHQLPGPLAAKAYAQACRYYKK